ncbi:MAG: hypothetical protein ACI8XO_001539 [Verrucomicrobiales bacterium]|jgi:hypothetical protein
MRPSTADISPLKNCATRFCFTLAGSTGCLEMHIRFHHVTSGLFTQHAPFAADYSSDKRSVYLMRKRNRATPFFALFNGSDPNASTVKPGLITAPTQARYFINDPFFHDCANRFAAKAIAAQPDERIEFVCRTLFARPATASDRADVGAFSSWLAGAGVKPGTVCGATDEYGMRPVEDSVHVHDFHATILHLLGLDHERLTYRHSGRDYRLTDVAGNVVGGVLT